MEPVPSFRVSTTTESSGDQRPENLEVCRKFMKGRCQRLNCPYIHSVPRTDLESKPTTDVEGQNKSTTRADSVRAICQDDFIRNTCPRGSDCPYVHVSGTEESNSTPLRPVPPIQGARDQSSRPMARIDGGRDEAKNLRSEVKSKKACPDFLRGQCRREKCPQLHVHLRDQPPSVVLTPTPAVPSVGSFLVTVDRSLTEGYMKISNPPFSVRSQPLQSVPPVVRIPQVGPRLNESKSSIVVRLPKPHSAPAEAIRNGVDDGFTWGDPGFWRPVNWGNSSTSSEDSLTEASALQSKNAISVATGTKHPPPRSQETCRRWLRGQCPFHHCYYTHGDLEYESSTPETSPSPPELPLSITIHDHTKVVLGGGFTIHDVTTSVETPWIILSDIPARVKEPAVRSLLARFGSVQDIRFPAAPGKDFMLIRARFSTPAEALHASTDLDRSTAFGTRITARMPVNSRNGMRHIQDSTVRIQWEAPSKVAYGGYPDLRRAHEAISATRLPCEDYYVHASVHVGLPSIGPVTVKFSNLPPGANDESMKRFSQPDDIMWERPNYSELDPAVDGVRRILKSIGDLRELDVLPPPYSHGLIRAYATFSSPSVARSAAANLHGRKPPWTGHTRVSARHVQTLIYRLTVEEYDKDASLIEKLREAAFRTGFCMAVVVRRLITGVVIRLSAEGIKALGWLKAEFEAISRGEILRQDGVAVWDTFFGLPFAAGYMSTIRVSQPEVRIHVDPVRRILRIFGTSQQRAHVRGMLLQKMADLKSQRVHVIRIPGRVVNTFIITHLAKLHKRFGAENIYVDMWQRTVTLRGGDQLFKAGTEAIHDVQQSSLARLPYRPNIVECPVCFNQVVSPITLPCGHTWCRGCFIQYLLSAVESRRFPLNCLGDEAKCTESIPLSTARSTLQPNEFNLVVEAALATYVHTHAKELHYCPSPDCSQIYRTGPKGTVVQCPSCLLRICPHCHAEAHDGFDCADRDGGNKLFKEWAARHDVKNCPGCDIPIERDEGCNHVTCIQCQTHICWVCLKTFPKGEGIYKHMRSEHGGIGLGEFG
ncbi:hypothetical protein FB45DRAFT_454457 [Roridomyces roridus]|uniref:RBR-type E3 ubiquitin transferase n=1 Tax=Roridomyces roridus TaxID=1738132 RepID=A0AAD7C2E1_9AGAR|nr:hypothetical protein FB45DRAFT_454457 [Roridomyces roridus]